MSKYLVSLPKGQHLRLSSFVIALQPDHIHSIATLVVQEVI